MGRGGKRAGAGRKPKPKLPQIADKVMAARVLAQADEEKRWLALLDAADERLRFDVLKYLTDRRDGKPVQAIQHQTEKPVEIHVRISRVGG